VFGKISQDNAACLGRSPRIMLRVWEDLPANGNNNRFPDLHIPI